MNEKALKSIEKLSINSIDIKILIFCMETPRSVSELQGYIGIAYKNLFPHIKKLKEADLIIVKENGRGRKKEISVNIKRHSVFYFLFGVLALWLPDDIFKKDKVLFDAVTNSKVFESFFENKSQPS